MSDDFTPYPVERSDATPPRLPAAGRIVGRVSHTQTRTELNGIGDTQSSLTVLSMRLTPTGREQPVEVELGGSSINGSVHDGDWIELADERAPSGRYEPGELVNLTTGSAVTTVGDPRSPAHRAVRIILIGVFLAVFLVILTMIIIGFVDFNSGFVEFEG